MYQEAPDQNDENKIVEVGQQIHEDIKSEIELDEFE